MSYCCFCDVSSTEETLYQCESKGCKVSSKLYCKSCGDWIHRKMNHGFIQNIEISERKEEEKKSEQISLNLNCNQNENDNSRRGYLNKAIGIGLGGATVLGFLKEAPVGGALMGTALILPQAAAIAMFATCAYSTFSSCKTKKNNAETHNTKAEAEMMALAMFNFDENDLKHKQRFNVEIIKKRYKRMSKYYHPDKQHGDNATFIRLDVSRRLLLSMCNPNQFEFPEDAYLLCCNDDAVATANKRAIEYPIQKKEEVQGGWFSGYFR